MQETSTTGIRYSRLTLLTNTYIPFTLAYWHGPKHSFGAAKFRQHSTPLSSLPAIPPGVSPPVLLCFAKTSWNPIASSVHIRNINLDKHLMTTINDSLRSLQIGDLIIVSKQLASFGFGRSEFFWTEKVDGFTSGHFSMQKRFLTRNLYQCSNQIPC